jgi:acyl-CoA reductase-like NAD-dependent aldehyde dehydrogenase
VVGVIAPWNYPFCIPMGEIVPALIAGNAVVIKPSELTAWVGSLLADLINCAGFPEGLVQVIQGDGNVGAALVEARPDKLFFTGSYATGLMIAQACARLMIPSVLELGGKGAMIILAGANLEQAANGAVWGSLMNCGQACVSPERIYVQESIADEFTRLCVEKVGKLRIGPPTDADAEIGPMIRPRQIERVEAQLEAAAAQGATILAGGKRYPDAGPWFFEPTVITGLDASMKIVREETFGPVVAISRVADAEEAIRLANDSPFALAASVWTGDARPAP